MNGRGNYAEPAELVAAIVESRRRWNRTTWRKGAPYGGDRKLYEKWRRLVRVWLRLQGING